MNKFYLASIVFLASLIAVSAGEFPDEDKDGICETPFCDRLDLCPKTACELLDIPVENCQNPDNTDTDGDGAADVCDECPTDPTRVQEPCPPPRRGPGGGSGGAGVETGCRSFTDFSPQFHQRVGWLCTHDKECVTLASKFGRSDPENYACVIVGRQQGAGAVMNNCECSYRKPPSSAPQSSIPTEIVQMELRGQTPPQAPPQQFAPSAPVQSPYVGRAFEQPSPGSPGWLPFALAGILVVGGVALYLVLRSRIRPQ